MATNYLDYNNTDKLAMMAAEVEYIADNGGGGGGGKTYRAGNGIKIDGEIISADTDILATTSVTDALQDEINAVGEPFRVIQWTGDPNITVPSVTQDIQNTSIPKMTFQITGEEADDYRVVGMVGYEVFDRPSGGNRLNFIPVCQFTGENSTQLNVRGCVMGPESKTIRRISAWVLLKHR